MADNVPLDALTGKAATDEVTFSGDANAQVQLLRPVHVTGTEGSKTVVEITSADGVLVNLGTNNDVTVTGTVTANAGTGTMAVSLASLPALAAGTNNIGDVDVLTVPAPLSTTGGGTEATALRVTVATDSTGVLSVDDNGGALTVDNGGTFAVQVDGAALTALQLIDDGVATVAAAVPAKGMAAAGTDGTNARLLKTDASGELQVDVLTLPALVAGTAYVGKVSLTDGTNDLAVDTVHGDGESNTENHLDIAAKAMLFNGTTWDRVRGDTTNGVDVDITRLPTAQVGSNSGVKMEGCTAHDTLDAGAPVKIGAKALAHGASPTAVGAADRTDLYANRHGVLWVIGGHPNIVTSRVTYAASAQTDVSLTGTINAGTKVVVTQIQVTVSNATTATPSVIVGFGATTTPTATGVVLAHPGIPGGGGVSRGDGGGILGVGADGEELRITAGAATGGTLDCVVSYYTIES